MTTQTPWVQEYKWGILERSVCNEEREEKNCAISYDGTDFKYLWFPSIDIMEHSRQIALDVENFQKNIPEYLGTYFSINEKDSFYHAWTCNEVVAKLLNIPIFIFIKQKLIYIARDISCNILTINHENKETNFLLYSLKIDCWNVWATFGHKV